MYLYIYLWLPRYIGEGNYDTTKVDFDEVLIEKIIIKPFKYSADLWCTSQRRSIVVEIVVTHDLDEQKEKFLPKLASGEMMGCFGLTEPDHGSDPGGMTTNFKSDGDYVILNGAKLWISNSPFADIAIVWAKDEDKRFHGLIVERGMEGFSTPETHNKWSLRASSTSDTIKYGLEESSRILSFRFLTINDAIFISSE